jgi:hypothetical protein
MAITWGSTVLGLSKYQRKGGELYWSEHDLIPDPTIASTVAQTVLQGSGRKRTRVSLEGYGTVAEIASFETDRIANTSRMLTIGFDNNFAMTMMIIDLIPQPPQPQKGSDLPFYTMELIEV